MSLMGDCNVLYEEAYLFKSTTNSDLVVQRRCKLYCDRFLTYHDFAKDPENSKTWYLDKRCTLDPASASDIKESIKSIRPCGTWTITATIKSKAKGQHVKLYHFTITWPGRWAAQGYTSFTMGFSTLQEAKHWHNRISQCIGKLKSLRNVSRPSTKSRLDNSQDGVKRESANGSSASNTFGSQLTIDVKNLKPDDHFVDATDSDSSVFSGHLCPTPHLLYGDAASSSDSDDDDSPDGPGGAGGEAGGFRYGHPSFSTAYGARDGHGSYCDATKRDAGSYNHSSYNDYNNQSNDNHNYSNNNTNKNNYSNPSNRTTGTTSTTTNGVVVDANSSHLGTRPSATHPSIVTSASVSASASAVASTSHSNPYSHGAPPTPHPYPPSPSPPHHHGGGGGGSTFATSASGVGSTPEGVDLCSLCSDLNESARHVRSNQRSNIQSSVQQRWIPFKQVNGVAIYRHRWSPQGGGDSKALGLGGEYMVSAVVRGSPRECIKVLVGCRSSTTSTYLGPVMKVEVLEGRRPPENMREVSRFTFRAPRLAGVLCAPREMVVESIIKVDPTGPSYVLMFNSCDVPARYRSKGNAGGRSGGNGNNGGNDRNGGKGNDNNNNNNNNICNATAPSNTPIHRSSTAPIAANPSNIAFMDDTSLKRDLLLTNQVVFDPVPKNFQIQQGILSSHSPGARQDGIIRVDSPCKTIDLNQASLGLNRLTIGNALIDTDRSSCNDACNANNNNNNSSSNNSNNYNRNNNHTNESCIMNGIVSPALQGICPVYTKSRSRDFTSVVSVAVKAIASAFDSVVVESRGEEIGFQPFIRRDGLNPSKAPINAGDNVDRAVDRDRDSKGATLFRTRTFPESAYPTSNPPITSFTSFPPPYVSSPPPLSYPSAPLAPSIPPSMKFHHAPSISFCPLSPHASNELLHPNLSPSLAAPPSSYTSRSGLLNGTGSFQSPLDVLEDPICPQQLKFSSAMSSYTTSAPSPSPPPPLPSSATQGTVLEHPRVESSLPLFPVSSTVGGVGMKGFEQKISLEQMICRENSIINAGNFMNCSSNNSSSSSSSSSIINNLLLGGGGMTNSDGLGRTYPMTMNSSISSNPSITHNPSISCTVSSAAAVAKPYGGGLSKDLKQLEMSFLVTKFPSFGQLLPSKTSPVKVTAHSRPGVITNILVKLLTEHQNITLITAGGDALHVAMVAVIAARYRLKESKGIQIILIPKIITVDTLSTLGWGSVFLKFEIIRWDAVNRMPSK
uniref:Uncharacterized protein n=1 Tax=Polytomella parva TaxID=51329 RepID=A0A7S0YB00_9CHLO